MMFLRSGSVAIVCLWVCATSAAAQSAGSPNEVTRSATAFVAVLANHVQREVYPGCTAHCEGGDVSPDFSGGARLLLKRVAVGGELTVSRNLDFPVTGAGASAHYWQRDTFATVLIGYPFVNRANVNATASAGMSVGTAYYRITGLGPFASGPFDRRESDAMSGLTFAGDVEMVFGRRVSIVVPVRLTKFFRQDPPADLGIRGWNMHAGIGLGYSFARRTK
jgi:hypothetical protein